MTTTTAIGYEKNLPVSDATSLIEREVEAPRPGPRDVVVDVRAVSVNPVDVKQRAGAPTDGFRVLGFDASGVVDSIGEDVTLFQPGDEVYYAGSIDRPGTNQRLHAVDERIVGRKPTGMSFADAAALPLTAITAWEALFDRLCLTSESTGKLLVVGATGGVGSIMLQLAEALLPNVTVIATASSRERESWVRELGAEHVVDHHGDLENQVLSIAPGGVDWIFTAHSSGQVDVYERIVAPFGHIVAIDDGPRDVSPLKRKCVSWHWEFMFTRPMHQTPDMIEQHRLLNRVAELAEEGRVRSTLTQVLSPLNAANLRRAHELVESGRTVGKVVLDGWD
ncbi:zinc-binding alcohol dehydrogenase family protein [Actinomycetaceae bacterium L2_0104]